MAEFAAVAREWHVPRDEEEEGVHLAQAVRDAMAVPLVPPSVHADVRDDEEEENDVRRRKRHRRDDSSVSERGAPVVVERKERVDPDDFAYQPIVAEVKDDEDEERDELEPDWCFLCRVSANPQAFGSSPFLHTLNNIRLDNYDKVSRQELANMLQTYYNQMIRPKLTPVSERRPWRKKVIMQHIEEHAPDPITDIQVHMRTVRAVMNCLTYRLRMTHSATGENKIETRNVQLYAQLSQLMQNLHRKAASLRAATVE